MSQKIEEDMVVTISYTLRDESGEILDSSEENGNLDFLVGYEGVMPGLEQALIGKKLGDSVDLSLSGEDAYGEYDEKLFFTVAKDEFPKDVELTEGLEFEAEIQDRIRYCTIEKITDDDMVHINANHPLAGQVLQVQAKVLGIREATDEELDHGHVHSDDDHHH